MLINFSVTFKREKTLLFFVFGRADFSQNKKFAERVCLALGKVPSNFNLHTNNLGILLNAN